MPGDEAVEQLRESRSWLLHEPFVPVLFSGLGFSSPVERLHAAGKRSSSGKCFTYVTLPVFKVGSLEVSNLNAVSAREHFGLTGHDLQEIPELPDGAQVGIDEGL